MENIRKKEILNIFIFAFFTGFIVAVIYRNLALTLIAGVILLVLLLTMINDKFKDIYFELKHIFSLVIVFIGIIVLINGVVLCVKANLAVDISEIKSNSMRSGMYVKGKIENFYTRVEYSNTEEKEKYKIIDNGSAGWIPGYFIVYIYTEDKKIIQVYISGNRSVLNMEKVLNGLTKDDEALKFAGIVKKRSDSQVFEFPEDENGNMTGLEVPDEDRKIFIENYVIQEYDYTNYPYRIIGGITSIIAGIILFFAFGGLKSVIIPPKQEIQEVEYDGSIYERWRDTNE